MRIAVDLLAGLLVGTGIGYVLDEWLGTKPWLMIVFFFFGAAAGFLNAYRTYEELDRKAKERKARDGKTAPGQPPPPDRDWDRDRGQDEDENDD